jgi:hypothetical protein
MVRQNIAILLLLAFISSSFIGKFNHSKNIRYLKNKHKSVEKFYINKIHNLERKVEEYEEDVIEYVNFRENLALSESGGNIHIINPIGARYKYQFMPSTMMKLGVNPYNKLSEKKQDILFNQWALLISKRLEDQIDEYVGTYVFDTIPITRSGIIATAHLGGIYGTKKFLTSGGEYNPDDGYTKLSDYMYKFRDYDF